MKIKELNEKIVFLNLIRTDVEDKLTWAIKKLAKDIGEKLSPIKAKMGEKADEIRIMNALEAPDGSILFDEKGNPKFSKQGYLKVQQELRDLNTNSEELEIDITPVIVRDCERVKELEPIVIENLKGLLFE